MYARLPKMTRAKPSPAPSAPADRREGPNSRLGLSRDLILEAALRLLDREGLDSLTMRDLAKELGVGAMTLYGYFRGKEELLDAVIDSGARDIAAAPADGDWKEGLRGLMLDVRRSHLEHPAVVELRFRRPLVSRGALEVTETAMRLLLDAGFSPTEAARAYRVLFVFTFGFSAFGPRDGGGHDRDQTIQALRSLPTERYPALAGAAEEAADAMADQSVFELGLDCLLDGLERTLPEAA